MDSSEDEGFDEDFPDYMPFLYSSRSGKQSYAFHPKKGDSTILKYFKPLEENEEKLRQYLNLILKTFFESKTASMLISTSQISTTSMHGEIPEDGIKLKHYFESIQERLLNSTKTSSENMVGHMTSSLPFFHQSIAKLITALNQNLVKMETAATFTLLERETINMLHCLFYKYTKSFYHQALADPSVCVGIVCSGGTIANLTAMWIARNSTFRSSGTFKGISKVGLPNALLFHGYNGVVIIGSTLMHYSFQKSIDVLGLGEDNLVQIPVNKKYQMKIDLLEAKILELKAAKICILAIIGIAGTTETGSFDDLVSISTIARTHSIHFHVDAAWGGPLIFSQDYKCLLHGAELADTITIDGHKQLYTPQGLGILLIKDPQHATDSIRKSANYIIRPNSMDSGKFTLEGSRPANILYLHASLYLLGKHGYNVILTRSISLVKQFYVRLCTHPSKAFKALHEPMTNILLYRYIPKILRELSALNEEENKWIDQIIIEMQERQGGRTFVSRTNVFYEGRRVDAFRIVVANPLTQWDALNLLINEQLEMGREMEKCMTLEKEVVEGLGNRKDELWIGWPFDM